MPSYLQFYTTVLNTNTVHSFLNKQSNEIKGLAIVARWAFELFFPFKLCLLPYAIFRLQALWQTLG